MNKWINTVLGMGIFSALALAGSDSSARGSCDSNAWGPNTCSRQNLTTSQVNYVVPNCVWNNQGQCLLAYSTELLTSGNWGYVNVTANPGRNYWMGIILSCADSKGNPSYWGTFSGSPPSWGFWPYVTVGETWGGSQISWAPAANANGIWMACPAGQTITALVTGAGF